MCSWNYAPKIVHHLALLELRMVPMRPLVRKVYNDLPQEGLHAARYPYLQNQSSSQQMLFYKTALPWPKPPLHHIFLLQLYSQDHPTFCHNLDQSHPHSGQQRSPASSCGHSNSYDHNPIAKQLDLLLLKLLWVALNQVRPTLH